MSILALIAFALLVFGALALLRASVNGKVTDRTVYAGLCGILATMMGLLFLPAILTALMVLSMIPLYLIGWHVVEMVREHRTDRTNRTAAYFSDPAAVEALRTIRHGYGFDEDGVPIGPGGVDLRKH